MILVLLVWIAFSALYSYWILWQIAGKEIITIGNGQMTIKRDLLGFGGTRAYPVAQIRNLRASGLFGSFYNWSGMMKFYGFNGGVVAFEYGDTTQRLPAFTSRNPRPTKSWRTFKPIFASRPSPRIRSLLRRPPNIRTLPPRVPRASLC